MVNGEVSGMGGVIKEIGIVGIKGGIGVSENMKIGGIIGYGYEEKKVVKGKLRGEEIPKTEIGGGRVELGVGMKWEVMKKRIEVGCRGKCYVGEREGIEGIEGMIKVGYVLEKGRRKGKEGREEGIGIIKERRNKEVGSNVESNRGKREIGSKERKKSKKLPWKVKDELRHAKN